MKKKVVVTGVGAVTSIGDNSISFWENCLAGKSGISEVEMPNIELLKAKNAGQIKDFKLSNYHEQKSKYELGRSTQLLIVSMLEAINMSKIDKGQIDKIYIGTTMGDVANEQIIYNKFNNIKSDNDLLRQNQFKNIIADASYELDIASECILFCNACSAGNYALVSGFESVRNGDADIIIAGGVDAFSSTAYYGFNRLGAAAESKCMPFDKNRQGMIVAEGSACLIIESEEHALNRNADIICEIVGYGISSDAYHINSPHPEGKGILQATLDAINYSNISPKDIGYISAHGTGTVSNDKIESKTLNEIFGARKVPISSIKSMIGHAMGAASAIESVACCYAIKHGKIPPTINFETEDEECDIDCVPNKYRELNIDYAINNSYAFGGSNASVIFKKYFSEVVQ